MNINIYKLLLKISSRRHQQEKNKLARVILSRDFYNQESKMPELFALAEISGSYDNNINIVSLLDRIELKIIERIQKIYNSISSRKSFQTDNLSEHLLELILKSLNGEIVLCFEESGLSHLKEYLNIFIGVLEPALIKNEKKYYFHFSHCNKIDAFLIFPQQNSYKIMNILEEGDKKNNEDNNKIFTNITSGQLDEDSFLIVCNENLIDYVIIDKLKQIIISMEEKEALKYLKNILLELDAELEFASIFISLLKDEAKDIFISPENSIEKLMLTEKNTEKFLTPSILPDFKKNFINLGYYIKKIVKKIYRRFLQFRGKILKLRVSGESAGKNITAYKNKTAKAIPNFIENLKKHTAKIINLSMKFISFFVDGVRKIAIKLINYLKKLNKIPLFQKVIFISLILAVAFFWQCTIWLKNERIKKQNTIIYNEALIELEQKFDSLEASLIYKNYEKSSDTLDEIDKIMEVTLAKNIEEYSDKYKELNNRVLDYKKEINKIINIDNIQTLNNQLDANSTISNIVIQDKLLVILDALNNKLFELNLFDNSIISWNSEKKLNTLTYYSESKDGITAYDKEENKVYEFKNKKSGAIKTLLSGAIADVKKYADSVYVIDTQNNQIYTYRYAKREEWIKDSSIDAKNMISMAIDGNIFALKNNGEILKYFRGKKENFSLQDIDPPLKNSKKIFTDADTKKLYLMDAENRRIIVFEKECKDSKCSLIAQYTSDKFTDLKDFAVDERNMAIYVLNGNEIFKFDIKN
ncbi:MAG: hypothetical protein V1891_03255 [bacterium]